MTNKSRKLLECLVNLQALAAFILSIAGWVVMESNKGNGVVLILRPLCKL